MIPIVLALLILPFDSAFADSFDIPAIETGLEMAEMGPSVQYSMKIEYALHNHKNRLDAERYALVIPIPSSTEYQRTTVESTEGFITKTVGRDKFGNCVLISYPRNLDDYPDYVSVDLGIEKTPLQFAVPESYYYETAVYTGTIDTLLKDVLQDPSDSEIRVSIAENADFKALVAAVDAFKTMVNGAGEGFSKYYDQSIRDFYPVDRTIYLKKAGDFLSALSEHGYAGRIARGWSFPPAVDTFREDFLVQVFLPDHGMAVFDRKLDLFADEYHFVEFHYTLTKSLDFTSAGYLGMTSGGRLHVFEERIYMSCGANESPAGEPEKRFSEQYYEMTGSEWGSLDFEDFIPSGITVDVPEFRTVWRMSQEKQHYDRPVEYRVRDIILSKKLDSEYDPLDISGEYAPGEKIYATIMFRGSGYEKHLIIRWISPSGSLFHTNEKDVKTTWTSYFNSLRLNENMEKGIWTVEAEVNGALEMRRQFELK